MREYNGGLTREQFLFYEIRIMASLVSQGYTKAEAIEKIKEENLFQFPTERMIASIANTCFQRLSALESDALVYHLANATADVAKQINLYAMMKHNAIVWDFMTTVVGEKFRTQEFEFSKKDLNIFFFQLQEQNDAVASWSEGTIVKIKQVLTKCLVECEFLDSRRILNGEVRPNVLAIQDSGFMTDDFIAYVAGKDTHMKTDLTLLRTSLKDAKEYGSIINMPKLNFAALYERMDIISREFAEDIFQIEFQTITAEQLFPLVKQAEIMAQKYDVVVTNPPYMGGSGMSNKLTEFVKKNYPDSKSDLFAVFIEKCGTMLNKRGYQAMITQHAWMFLSSFEKLRTKLLARDTVNMAHLGARAFEEIGGEVVQTTSFVLRNIHTKNYKGTYCRLIDPTTQSGKEEMFLSGENRFVSSQSNFSKIPGSPIAYWLTNGFLKLFDLKQLNTKADACKGLDTGDNERFLRFWFEIMDTEIGVGKKWVPYNKGGGYRRWYGLNEYVILWENDGYQLKYNSKANIRNETKYFLEGLTWSDLSTANFGARYCKGGFAFDASGPMLFSEENLFFILAYMNSSVYQKILDIICPGLHYNNGAIAKTPIPSINETDRGISFAKQNIGISQQDWDSFETSWDFKKHPLV